MTAREIKIAKAILETLHDSDGAQMIEVVIHADVTVSLQEKIPLAEFDAAMSICDKRRWLTGVAGKFGGRKWNINDAGESARLEL